MESSIKVKLLSSGRYSWEINVIFNESATEEILNCTKLAKQIDNQLRESFPDHVLRGTGKAVNIDED